MLLYKYLKPDVSLFTVIVLDAHPEKVRHRASLLNNDKMITIII